MKKDLQLYALLQKNTPPQIHNRLRRSQITALTKDAMSMEYLGHQSLLTQVMTQLSYISGWVWAVQAGYLALLYLLTLKPDFFPLCDMMMLISPGLSLILLYELSKSFSYNMGEMEASCRYNLPRIFFLRLCILSGADFLILGGALIVFLKTGEMLWKFCLFTLLPFFLTCAFILHLLRKIGNRIHFIPLAVISLSSQVFYPLAESAIRTDLDEYGGFLTGRAIPAATVLALLLFLYNAAGLCRRQHYINENGKERKIWSFN